MQLEDFVSSHAPDESETAFQLENSKMLDVAVDGAVMAKAGTMVAYTGDVSFERTSAGGLTRMLKKKVTGEGSVVMEASGRGHRYLADAAKEVQVLELDEGEEIRVNGNDVVAFEQRVDWDIKMMSTIVGTSAGGLFNVFLRGPGTVAITTHGEPIVVPPPVSTDPNATVAWSGNVSPGTKRDLDSKGFLGRDVPASFREPDGFVVVQPNEETQPGDRLDPTSEPTPTSTRQPPPRTAGAPPVCPFGRYWTAGNTFSS